MLIRKRLKKMRRVITGIREFLLASQICGVLLLLAISSWGQDNPSSFHREQMNEIQKFLDLTNRVEKDPSSLNRARLEDYQEFSRLAILAKLIKPYCPSLLPNEFPLPEVPVIKRLPPGLKSLWMQAANQPEMELQLNVAESIARASDLEMADWQDLIPILVKMLETQTNDRVVRLAAARTLVVIKAREAIPALREHALLGLDFARQIEPALADWNDLPMQPIWLSRLESRTTSPGLLTLAIQGSAKTELKAAIPLLSQRVLDQKLAPPVRLEAAKALGHLAEESVVEVARQLAAETAVGRIVLDHLLAAHLLVKQESIEAVQLLQQLAVDPESATASVAFRRLLELDPALTRSAIDPAIKSPDPALRQLAAESLFRLQTPADIAQLSKFLDDSNAYLRSATQQWLVVVDARAELSHSLRESVMTMLNSDAPRGIAQAAIVVGRLDHKPAADRLVELLNHQAPDVSIAVAWSLRRLAVASTAEPILRHLTAETEKSLIEIPIKSNPDLNIRWNLYERHKHLIEAMGVLRYAAADSLLRQFLPVPPNPPVGHQFFWIHCTHRSELRTRAIWALGQIHTAELPEDLVRLLIARLQDQNEVPHVASLSALSLGRAKVAAAEPVFSTFYSPEMRYSEKAPAQSILAMACRRALESITGQPLPPLEVDPYWTYKTGWFLEPLDFDKN